jgi:hypothetical protein
MGRLAPQAVPRSEEDNFGGTRRPPHVSNSGGDPYHLPGPFLCIVFLSRRTLTSDDLFRVPVWPACSLREVFLPEQQGPSLGVDGDGLDRNQDRPQPEGARPAEKSGESRIVASIAKRPR